MKKPNGKKKWRQVRKSVRGSQKGKKILMNQWTGEYRYRKGRTRRTEVEFKRPQPSRWTIQFTRVLKGWPPSPKKAHQVKA